MTDSVYALTYQAILEDSVERKCKLVERLWTDWQRKVLSRNDGSRVKKIETPGRPSRPQLVHPRQVPRRTLSTQLGRIVMLHSFAHIEFNAINLALDAAYRFRDMPDSFVTDWLTVAREEAKHFWLLQEYLQQLGSFYGEYDAHNGLWDMVCKTRHDVLHRMALVPRVMEARGLDVTPGLMEKFRQIGDQRAVEILGVIYQEEIGHVRIGNHWYHYCCQQRNLDARETFRDLIDQYFSGRLRGPFNRHARLQAGFNEDELVALENAL